MHTERTSHLGGPLAVPTYGSALASVPVHASLGPQVITTCSSAKGRRPNEYPPAGGTIPSTAQIRRGSHAIGSVHGVEASQLAALQREPAWSVRETVPNGQS
jgi:hypothetical protein